MLILLKQSIKTTVILLLFIVGGTYLHAGNLFSQINQNESGRNPLTISVLNNRNAIDPGYYLLEDTVITGKSGNEKKEVKQDEFRIPERMANTQINFRINSAISYLNFKHFVRNESKKMFFQAWLKEKELKKLSDQTDSLRKAYSNAASGKKDGISLQILRSEKRSIALNEEIPAMYQKALDEEYRYWQTASPEEITRFQEKIRMYKDSIGQIETAKSYTIPDTLNIYPQQVKLKEIKVTEPSGIIYKIQVGAYKGKMPESASKLIKKLSVLRKVENYIDDKGVKIYTTGNLILYQEALTMQRQVKQEGIKNAVITAFRSGKKITVDEARKLNNEL